MENWSKAILFHWEQRSVEFLYEYFIWGLNYTVLQRGRKYFPHCFANTIANLDKYDKYDESYVSLFQYMPQLCTSWEEEENFQSPYKVDF